MLISQSTCIIKNRNIASKTVGFLSVYGLKIGRVNGAIRLCFSWRLAGFIFVFIPAIQCCYGLSSIQWSQRLVKCTMVTASCQAYIGLRCLVRHPLVSRGSVFMVYYHEPSCRNNDHYTKYLYAFFIAKGIVNCKLLWQVRRYWTNAKWLLVGREKTRPRWLNFS
jgi:hypothetical protein